MAVSAVTLSLLAACSGDNGKDGTDGADGANGTSCTVESLTDSSGYKILCGGDSVGVLLNDANGESCTASSVDGGYELTCGGKTIGTITQTCGDDEVVLYKAVCGTNSYDPTQYTCADGKVQKYCFKVNEDGKSEITDSYDTTASYCNSAGVITALGKCGEGEKAVTFDTEVEYCSNKDTTVQKKTACGKGYYNPETEYCSTAEEVKALSACEVDVATTTTTITDGEEHSTSDFVKKTKLYNPELTICDERDYNVYGYTTIGDQIWTSTEMRYTKNNAVGQWYSNSNNNSSGARYYTWSEALAIDANNTVWNNNEEGVGIQGVCPNGWHVPSLTEVNTLRAYLGEKYEGCEAGEGECGNALKDESWGDGTDEYEFSATATGAGTRQNNNYNYSRNGGFFMWTTAQTNDATIANQATRFNIAANSSAFTQTTAAKTTRYPVRCIKDYPPPKTARDQHF